MQPSLILQDNLTLAAFRHLQRQNHTNLLKKILYTYFTLTLDRESMKLELDNNFFAMLYIPMHE